MDNGSSKETETSRTDIPAFQSLERQLDHLGWTSYGPLDLTENKWYFQENLFIFCGNQVSRMLFARYSYPLPTKHQLWQGSNLLFDTLEVSMSTDPVSREKFPEDDVM